jgi:NAD(P)-dependent dehydrogenase (short-subunit alcohol dehydrogenase family)
MADTSMQGRICLVTGGSTGIGKVTALELARRGAQVTIVSRDKARGEAALADIRQQSGNQQVELILADLSSMKEVRRVAARFLATHDRLHVLVNNAGVILTDRVVTEDNLEATFAINHLAYFLLTELLQDLLIRSAPARIINVASGAHLRGHINFDDLQAEKSYSGLRVYCNSKLANLLFTQELARRLDGTHVTANSVHPGPVATSWGTNTSGWFKWGHSLFRPFMITPEKGAETSVYLATSSDVAKVSGQYFAKMKRTRASKEANDPAIAKRLWKVSEQLTRKVGA